MLIEISKNLIKLKNIFYYQKLYTWHLPFNLLLLEHERPVCKVVEWPLHWNLLCVMSNSSREGRATILYQEVQSAGRFLTVLPGFHSNVQPHGRLRKSCQTSSATSRYGGEKDRHKKTLEFLCLTHGSLQVSWVQTLELHMVHEGNKYYL